MFADWAFVSFVNTVKWCSGGNDAILKDRRPSITSYWWEDKILHCDNTMAVWWKSLRLVEWQCFHYISQRTLTWHDDRRSDQEDKKEQKYKQSLKGSELEKSDTTIQHNPEVQINDITQSKASLPQSVIHVYFVHKLQILKLATVSLPKRPTVNINSQYFVCINTDRI